MDAKKQFAILADLFLLVLRSTVEKGEGVLTCRLTSSSGKTSSARRRLMPGTGSAQRFRLHRAMGGGRSVKIRSNACVFENIQR